jgi:hypothetical protein
MYGSISDALEARMLERAPIDLGRAARWYQPRYQTERGSQDLRAAKTA